MLPKEIIFTMYRLLYILDKIRAIFLPPNNIFPHHTRNMYSLILTVREVAKLYEFIFFLTSFFMLSLDYEWL